VAARSSVPLDTRNETVRVKESPIGNLIADLMREATGADVALINGGGIRGNAVTPAGPLTRGDVLKILPFANKVVKLEVSGDALRAALENGLSQHERTAGRFHQVSGCGMSSIEEAGVPDLRPSAVSPWTLPPGTAWRPLSFDGRRRVPC
jgi:2',3'-cyclic-nucleotide 2'-phosphodiesterase (5'-nucleotidase family)